MKRLLLAAVLVVSGALRAQDLSSLPEYRPEQAVSGVIRSWGNNHMAILLRDWEQGFHRYQPGVAFTDDLKGTGTAVFGLNEWVADLALMGRQIYTYEYYGVYRRSLLLPIEVPVATGSLDVPGKSFALTVFVHRDNPLARLTLKQLDGIFGAERTGGWDGMKWRLQSARAASGNLLNWGQLGLTGSWASRPIHPYGPPGIYPGGISYFQRRVMGGADTWAEGLREYADRKEMMEALSRDPLGIAFTGLGYGTAATKPIALAETDRGPFLLPTRATVGARTYPLSRTVYIYLAPDPPPGDPASLKSNPKLREFLRYILSRQGQEDVQREGDYLPLTAALVRSARENLR